MPEPLEPIQKLRLKGCSSIKRKMAKLSWKSFEDYRKATTEVWKITELDPNDALSAVCTCKQGMKEYYCKHSLGIAIRLGFVEVPAAAKDIPPGEKRKRGHPKQARKALIRQ
jgi:hypothetical protein